MSDKNPEFASEQQRPTRLQVRVVLSADPGFPTFKRDLEFAHHDASKSRISVPLPFTRESATTFAFDTAAAYLSTDATTRARAGLALHRLATLVDMGNRTYWDRMYLANRGGSSALQVARLRIALTYGGVTYRRPPELEEKEIVIVDRPIGATLPANDGELSLESAARKTRRALVGVDSNSPELLKLLAGDLGKSGSDAADNHGKNPKYGPRLDNLCSEFASWYYYEAGIKVNGKSVRDVEGTQRLHDLFKEAGRLYTYKRGEDKLIKVGGTQTYAHPRPGDFLERRGTEGAEHSMIIHRWIPGDPSSTVEHERSARAIVFNGPWPVFLREVHLRADEAEGNDDFYVGKI